MQLSSAQGVWPDAFGGSFVTGFGPVLSTHLLRFIGNLTGFISKKLTGLLVGPHFCVVQVIEHSFFTFQQYFS